MNQVYTPLPVGPDQAFAPLEDPRSFLFLVAGARAIRSFDPRWPEVGTVMHHSVGFRPLLLRDITVVIAVDRPRLLVMDAGLARLGALRVEFRFAADGDGSELMVKEVPCRGPVSWPVVHRVIRAALAVRNRAICRRYRRLIERRAQMGREGRS